MYKVVFMGTPDFGVPALETMFADPRFQVLHVFSQPDRPQGRKQVLLPTPIKEVALRHQIPCSQPEKLRTEENIELLASLQPDFIVVVAYGKIIPKRILDIPRFGCINIHGSLLPKYRGASPIQAALLHGEKETGITIMLLSEGMDEGAMLSTFKTKITEDTTSASLFTELSIAGAKLLPDTLDRFAKGEIKPEEQIVSQATYCGKIEKEMGEIHPAHETADEIYHKWQAFTPWPGIFLFHEGKRIKILELHRLVEKTTGVQNDSSSPFVLTSDKKLFLQTSTQLLEILKIQPEGKRILSAQEYITGLK